MKWTLDLADVLLIEAKTVAARRRPTLEALVEHALRREIQPSVEATAVKDTDDSANKVELRRLAEEKLASKPDSFPNADPVRLIHELQVHQIELEMLNEELRASRAVVEKRKDRHFDFYDFSPVAFVRLSKVADILEINLTAATMLGLPRANMIGSRFELFLASADLRVFNAVFLKALSTGTRQTSEVKLEGSNRSTVYVQIDLSNSREANERRAVIMDITERMKEQEALLKSKQRHDNLVSKIPGGICILHGTLEGAFKFDYVSPNMAEILNISAESILADPQVGFNPIHPDDLAAFVELNRKRFRQPEPFQWEGRAVIGGAVKWLQIKSEPESTGNGNVISNGIVSDSFVIAFFHSSPLVL